MIFPCPSTMTSSSCHVSEVVVSAKGKHSAVCLDMLAMACASILQYSRPIHLDCGQWLTHACISHAFQTLAAGRTNTRAAWAAQLAQDMGLRRCLVYRQGVYGWRLDQCVQAYKGYKVLDPPPEPEAFQLESIDVQRGLRELQALGL
jgi:hypothetical protein